MANFNAAYDTIFVPGRLTLGFMTPFHTAPETLAPVDETIALAALADQLGFAALWARDVPLMIPQGADNTASALDDPFLWLARLAFATRRIAVGAAAIVLPLRHPLHVAKAALTLDRLSGGRFVLGLGSGDRPEEFQAFGQDLEARREAFRERWPLVRSALAPAAEDRALMRSSTDGYDVLPAPTSVVPMIVVGSARQSVQWIAEHSEAWATYHRPEAKQQGRISLWRNALNERVPGQNKPFIQSAQLELLDDPDAPAEPLELGLRAGRRALLDYLQRIHEAGVAHVIFNLHGDRRPPREVIQEIGEEILAKV